jgi:hypothetical protein
VSSCSDDFGCRIDAFERELIDYIVLWAPYGGPPADEILPRFGILNSQLPDRVLKIVSRTLHDALPAADRALLIRALATVTRSRPVAEMQNTHRMVRPMTLHASTVSSPRTGPSTPSPMTPNAFP